MLESITDLGWEIPPKNLVLGSDEVHVWQASLDNLHLVKLQQTLSVDEQARANRFRFQKDREHFIAARGLLRTILGSYLNAKPGELQFCYGPYGKPAIELEACGNGIRFNLSHSHGLALYALTRGREIGVDLELIRPDLANDAVAERFFSPNEVAMFRSLTGDFKEKAFFNYWTCKEAYIKARGEGLSSLLDKFDVLLAPDASAVMLKSELADLDVSRWSLRQLFPQINYAAALVVEGHDWLLKCWTGG